MASVARDGGGWGDGGGGGGGGGVTEPDGEQMERL